MVNGEIAIQRSLLRFSNLSVDVQNFLIDLASQASAPRRGLKGSGGNLTTELSRIEVIFGACGEVGIGTRIVAALALEGDRVCCYLSAIAQ